LFTILFAHWHALEGIPGGGLTGWPASQPALWPSKAAGFERVDTGLTDALLEDERAGGQADGLRVGGAPCEFARRPAYANPLVIFTPNSTQ